MSSSIEIFWLNGDSKVKDLSRRWNAIIIEGSYGDTVRGTIFYWRRSLLRKLIIVLSFLMNLSAGVYAQPSDDRPEDFSSQDFHRGRREALRDKLTTEFCCCIFCKCSTQSLQ